jgi:pimeloyl-ACP methyl ester carboxylesterase
MKVCGPHCHGHWPDHPTCKVPLVRKVTTGVSLVSLVVFLALLLAIWTHSLPWPSRDADSDYPSDLKYGIRWFKVGNQRAGDYNAPPPNLTAPSLIFVHGWQRNSAVERLMETFNYLRIDSKYGVDSVLADPWLKAGWNVGIFFWTPFADEPEVTDAEAKIWSTNGPKGMRWRMPGGQFSTSGAPDITVAELLVDSYLKIFNASAQLRNVSVRLAGHSLGSQVVGRATFLLADLAKKGLIGRTPPVDRVSLLDPYMTLPGREYLNGAAIGDKIVDYWTNVTTSFPTLALEILISSDTNTVVGNGNSKNFTNLAKMATVWRMYPDWIDYWDLFKIGSKHCAAMPMYMQSINRTNVPAAGAADNATKAQKGTGLYIQTDGKSTFTPTDDKFELTNAGWTDDYSGPGPNEFTLVILGIATMGLISAIICCCCVCCAVRITKELRSTRRDGPLTSVLTGDHAPIVL